MAQARAKAEAADAGESGWPGAALGFLIGIALHKLGNPVTLDHLMAPPKSAVEVIFMSWPMKWGFLVLIPAAVIALRNARFAMAKPAWIVWCLLGWLGWCVLSSARSVDPSLTRITLLHFVTAVGVFFLGLWGMSAAREKYFLRTLFVFFLFVLWLGFDQKYGGLEETRKLFKALPNWQTFPKEYIAKIESERIFSTLVYPNAFAGAILLWLPVTTVALWAWLVKLPNVLRMVLVGLFIYMGVACFFWTGSKAGWLIAIAVTGFALLHAPMKRQVRIAIVVGVAVVGLAGFAYKYRDYFARGATSASARFIYWESAARIALERPVLGSGPGTFGKLFATMKPAEAEMARLVHNDYLQQASDSGVPAFLAFLGFAFGGLVIAYRTSREHPVAFAAWLGLLGWALQSFVEFGLYIPAISWSAFLLIGWLVGRRIGVDKPAAKA